jgi:hypothetical protein
LIQKVLVVGYSRKILFIAVMANRTTYICKTNCDTACCRRDVCGIVRIMNMNMLWSPSQSLAAKDICAHLSDKERRTAMLLAGKLGLWIAGFLNLIFFLIIFLKSNILLGVVPFLCVVFFLGFSRIIRKQKKFLLNTSYARDNGYTGDQI